MIFYLWGESSTYIGNVDLDETGPLPERSTPTLPPKTTGTQVAQWTGTGWVTLESPPEPPPAPTPDWPTLIESRRYQAEIAGITIDNMRFDTDDRSKTLITGAALKAMRSTDFVLRWKTAEGFVDLPAAQVLTIADAVSDRTQLCFDREDALLGAVADGSITSAMVEEGWPT